MMRPSRQYAYIIIRQSLRARDAKYKSRASLTTTHRIPDLQLDLFVHHGNHARAELDADSQVVDVLETLIGELKE